MRYVIRHHPGLMTELHVEEEGGASNVIENRMSWGVLREYCRDSLKGRGVEPVIVKPEPYVEVFPWITV